MPSKRTWAIPRALQSLFNAGSLTGLTDGQLIERFALREGEDSESAFAALVERHGTLVWCTCRAVLRDEHEAGDAFQATFLVLVRKAGSLWVRESIAPWLHRVALRAAGQARRQAIRRKAAEQRAAELNAGWADEAGPDDLADVIHEAIDRLPERHRIVVVLCDLEGRSYEEAARHLGCPVGTVKSRLARARERLRAALTRRGLMPAAALRDAMAAVETPPFALTASTIRGSVWFGIDEARAAGAVTKTAVILMEGVLRTMIRVPLQKVILMASAAFGLLVPAWLVQARQAAPGRPGAEAPVAVPKDAERPINLEGNWIVRGYPYGKAFGLIRIEASRQQPRATLLSVEQPEHTHLAESKVDRLRIDEEAVRFVLELGPKETPVSSRTFEIVAYLPRGRANPEALWGSMEWGGQGQFPAKLERTDRTELDLREGPEPAAGVKELHEFNQIKDHARQQEILGAILKRYDDMPTAQSAVMGIAIARSDDGAPPDEVRALVDRAVLYSARYGREMEIGGINRLVRMLIGREDMEGFLLDRARRAVAMLRPSDPVNLQETALKNLASALRKAVKIEETKARAEARTLEDRIAALRRAPGQDHARAARVDPAAKADTIPWARNFAAARKRAGAEGKLIMVEFAAESSDWCRRLDVDVFPSPEVAGAMRAFVAVKVDPDDGEGRPLLARYRAHIEVCPTFLFLDPAIDDPGDARIVGKIPGYMPADIFADHLTTIARLPRDVDAMAKQVHPEDGDAMRRLATALTMQGRVKEAIALVDRAWGPGADRAFDRWATVYNTIADEVAWNLKTFDDVGELDVEALGGEAAMLRKFGEAAGWYGKAARIAKRPIDAYNARLGAGFVAALQQQGGAAARELEAAARAAGVSPGARAFAVGLLRELAEPPDGQPEAAAALKRLP